MVRKYERTPGSRKYGNYNEDNLLAVTDPVKSGQCIQSTPYYFISKATWKEYRQNWPPQNPANVYKVPRTTLFRRLLGRNIGKIGHPTVLTAEEERLITETLGIVSHWGFPLTKPDIRDVVKKYLDKQGKQVRVFRDNTPGSDFTQKLFEKFAKIC
ncbi:hypothetical protein QE152_g6890 [Popillia japonica]|uniref:Uncharacterized protein n=1 Tax=Popillia japonica TaxID=7064 RepID=A0AAW1MDU6_POPJA